MRILVVEDERVSSKFMTGIVSDYATCDTAENGEEAFDKFEEAFQTQRSYDLIFLDIMMPQVDGQECLEAIRIYEEENGISITEGVKVIMTTALDDMQNVYLAHSHACSDYIVKPLSKDKIVKSMKKLGLLGDNVG